MLVEDHILLKRYSQDDDQKSFEALVQRYGPMVLGAAQREVGVSDLANDITQEVFITLAKKSSTISSKVSLPGWLFRVTRTVVIDHLRSRSKRQQRETQYSMDPSLSSEESKMCWEELAPVINDTLLELSEGDRNLVLMRYFSNRSHRSIATSLSISEEAARKRISRAMVALRDRLTSRGLTFSAATLLATIPAHASPPLSSTLLHSISSASTSVGIASVTQISLIQKIIIMTTKIKVITAVASVAVVTMLIYSSVTEEPSRTQEDSRSSRNSPQKGDSASSLTQKASIRKRSSSLSASSSDWERLFPFISKIDAINGEPARFMLGDIFKDHLKGLTEDELADAFTELADLDFPKDNIDFIRGEVISLLSEKNPHHALTLMGNDVFAYGKPLWRQQIGAYDRLVMEDPTEALAWLDQRIKDANFNTKTLVPTPAKVDPRVDLEISLIRSLSVSDPGAVAARLEDLSEKQRWWILYSESEIWRNEGEMSVEYNHLVRESLNEQSANDTIGTAWSLRRGIGLDDVSDSLNEIAFTEGERTAIVERSLREFYNISGDDGASAYQVASEWAQEHVPEYVSPFLEEKKKQLSATLPESGE